MQISQKSLFSALRTSLVVVLLALAGLVPSIGLAATANDIFEDGNRLFRDDLYWAALLRYEQAYEAGMNTPQLHYNTGVAHYKAGQYVRARQSFRQSAKLYSLQPISNYNLGLTAWAAGDDDEALTWFRKARDQDQSKQIRSLAIQAIRRIKDQDVEQQQILVRSEAKEKEKDIYSFYVRALVGGGVDSNVFRTPAEPYVDLSNPSLPLITPVVQEGFYIPVSVNAKYSIQSFENESFFGAYRLTGHYYQDEALTNGNRYSHEARFGSEYDRRDETHRRQVYSAFTIAQHDEIYYDRDSGIGNEVNDIDITERYNYHRYGPEMWFRQSYEKLSLGIRGKAQIWNYENTEEVPEYDHEYFLLGLTMQYNFTPGTLLRLTGTAYQRNFGDRPSFELDGTQPLGTPTVEYDYFRFSITARQRITNGVWFGLDMTHTERDDKYVGYNSYVRNTFGGELHWDITNRFFVDLNGYYQIYNYENAYAFNTPAGGRRTLERALGSARMSFQMTNSLSLLGEYRFEDVVSNDARVAFDRSQMSLSIIWEHL